MLFSNIPSNILAAILQLDFALDRGATPLKFRRGRQALLWAATWTAAHLHQPDTVAAAQPPVSSFHCQRVAFADGIDFMELNPLTAGVHLVREKEGFGPSTLTQDVALWNVAACRWPNPNNTG